MQEVLREVYLSGQIIVGFLFPAFLSHALINTGSDTLGYPFDHAARASFQINLIFMLLSIAGFASSSRFVGAGCLALILFLQVPEFEYLSSASSRDAFRIIPLVLFANCLSGLSPRRLKKSVRKSYLIAPMIFSSFSITGHTLGGFVLVNITLAWILWNIISRATISSILIVSIAIGIGALAGGNHYIRAYLETGSMGGDNVQKESIIANTPLMAESQARKAIRLHGTTGYLDRFMVFISKCRYRLSIPGLFCAFFSILFLLRYFQSKDSVLLPFLGLIVISNTLAFFGIFDFTGIKLSEWYIMNLRYPLHWYPFAAICVSQFAFFWYYKAVPKTNSAN